MSAYVHLDEPGAQPHMHFAFVPTVETVVMTNDKEHPLRWTAKDEEKNPAHRAGEVKRDSKGTVRYRRVPLVGEDGKPVVRRTATASKLFTKRDMAELHPAMERHLCAALGVEHVGMVLDETDRDRKWSELDHDDYVTVTTQRDKALAEVERANRELAAAKSQLAACQRKVEGFAARFDRLKLELAQIADALSVRGFLGSFKAKLIEFADNPVCKAALAAGRMLEIASDGKRAEKVLVDGGREKADELRKLGDEVRVWSPFDEVDEERATSRELERSGGSRGWDDDAR